MAVGLLLWLLLAKGLALEGDAAATFSSRLVHRFSEEVKAHLASRGSGAKLQSWPNKSTSEYFRLLLNSDLTRQGVKLGSQYESMYSSKGGQTFFFGNDWDWLHYTWIDIGTPNVSFLVALDTGSDLLWVPCDCIECAPLSAGHYDVLVPLYMGASLMQDRDLNQYSPSLSSTSRHLPCSHQLCTQGSDCKSSKDPCFYNSQYETDNTSSSGFLIEDKLHLTSNSRHTAEKSVPASIILGCGRKQSGGYLDGAAPDGVLGLGPGSISVPSLLAEEGLIRNSFSICFNDDESGRILFGDQGHVTQQSTQFLPVDGEFIAYIVGVERFCVGSFCLKGTGFQALFDSGSSFTYLPHDIYKKVVMEFDKQVNATRVTFHQSPWEYCYDASSQEVVNTPPIKLAFSKNQTFLIRNPLSTFSINEEYTAMCLTVGQSENDYVTIGQNYLRGYRLVFDKENLQFGWSRSNCEDSVGVRVNSTSPSPSTLPANQQQSSPNTHSVPPAIAGHTSPKPSTAAPGFTFWHLLNSMSLICLLLFW